MDKYVDEMKKNIDKNFWYLEMWLTDFPDETINPTLELTKYNFLIIWLNFINELLLEDTISVLYKKYFNQLYEETSYAIYTNYELSKIDKIVWENNDATFKWFSNMVEKINWRTMWKSKIINFIKTKKWDWTTDPIIEKFEWHLSKIYFERNKIAHNSERYFRNKTGVGIDITKINWDIKDLKEWFYLLSEKFFEAMNLLLNFYYKTLIPSFWYTDSETEKNQ